MNNYRKGPWFSPVNPSKSLPSNSTTSVIAILSVLSSCFVHAVEEDSAIDQADFLSEVPIVSSATRLNQKITDVPAAITIIDREMIEASGATEIPQLFKLVPGYLSYYVFGNQFGVTNRGITIEFPGDLEVMIDGRSVYEPVFSAVEWSSLGITVDDIEYIEILRGSNTPAYGSNAYLGAINIVTTSPVQTEGSSVSVTVGDIQTRNARLKQSGQIGALDYSVGVSYRSNHGFPRLSTQEDPIPFDRIRDSNEAHHLNLKLVYTPSVYDTVEFQAGVGESDVDIPGNDITDGPEGFNRRKFENNYQLLRWIHGTPNNNEIRVQFYHNRLEVDEVRKLGPLSGLLSKELGMPIPPEFIPLIFDGHPDEDIVTGVEDTISERFDLEFQQSLNLTEVQRLVWGSGVRYDKMRSEFLLGQEDSLDEYQYRLFGNWEWRPGEKWTVNIGAMAENNNIVGDFISPRAAMNYQFLPGHVLRTSYTYGHRTPSILEANQSQATRFADGTLIDVDVIVDENLEESRVREYELGYLGSFAAGKLSVDLRIFRTEADDVVGEYTAPFPDLTDDVSVIFNTMEWVTKGVDTQIQFRPDSATLISLQYAYTDFQGTRIKRFEVPEIPKLHRELPRHNINLLASRSFGNNWSASFVWYYLSEVAWRQGDLIREHGRLDMRLAKTFHISGNPAKVELIAHNLLNSYEEFEDFNLFETRVFLRLSLNFN